MKKRSKGIMLLGWTIIISSIISFLPLMLQADNFISTLAMSITVAPTITFFITGSLLGQDLVVGGLFMYASFLVSLGLGIGILKLNNITRILTIIISWVKLGLSLFMGYNAIVTVFVIRDSHIAEIEKLIIAPIAIAVYIIYLVYLSRPKVKEQFK